MVVLKELLGTAYPVNNLDFKVREALEKIPEGETVNLCGLRFGPQAAKELEPFYGKLIFTNSEFSEWDNILKYNRDIALNPEREFPTLDFSSIVNIDNFVSSIPKIPAGDYLVKVDTSSIVDECLLILTMMMRPDINYDLSDCMASILGLVSSYLSLTDFTSEEYIYLVEPPYAKKIKRVDVPRNLHIWVPYSFSNMKLISFAGEEKVEPPTGYASLIKFVIKTITKAQLGEKEEKQTDITRYLNLRGE